MKLKGLVVVFAGLLVLLAVFPVFASQPKQVVSVGIIQYRVPNSGVRFTTDDIVHARDAMAISYVTGTPWGVWSLKSVSNSEYNAISLVGSGVSKSASTGPAVLIEGTNVFQQNGMGLFTYHGPTFVATTNSGGTFTVTDGTKFSGILLTGTSIMHGTVNGEPVQVRDDWTGVGIAGPLTYGLDGNAILSGALTYWFTA